MSCNIPIIDQNNQTYLFTSLISNYFKKVRLCIEYIVI